MSNQWDIQGQKISSISLTAKSCDRSLHFYTQALLFEVVSDITVIGEDDKKLENLIESKIRIVTLQLGEEIIELREYLNIESQPIPCDSQNNDLWFQHLAIVVSDMEQAYTHLLSFPITPISVEPQTIPPDNQASAGVRAFKFKDPDGHNLELIWFPSDKGKDKWHQKSADTKRLVDRHHLFLGIDHSAIAISNTEQSLHFYCDLLGMQVNSHSLNKGETQARLDNLPGAEVKITALQPVQGGVGIELLDYIVPGKGRPIPKDWQSCDIANMQIKFVVNDIDWLVNQLRSHGFEIVSPTIVQFSSSVAYQRACLVKDPDGHTILLTSEN